MSLKVIVREKLEHLLSKLNEDVSSGDKNIGDEVGDLFEELQDNSYGFYIDKLECSEACDEDGLMIEFNSFDDEKKRILVLVMDIVCKMGRKESNNELVKQVMWFEKLKSGFPQY